MNDEDQEALHNRAAEKNESLNQKTRTQHKNLKKIEHAPANGAGSMIIGFLVVAAIIGFILFAYLGQNDGSSDDNFVEKDPVQECVDAAQKGKDFSDQLNDESQLQQDCEQALGDSSYSEDDDSLQNYIETIDASKGLSDQQKYGTLITSINEGSSKITIETHYDPGSYDLTARGLCRLVATWLEEQSQAKSIEILDGDGNVFVKATSPSTASQECSDSGASYDFNS